MKTFQAALFLVLATGIHLVATPLRQGPRELNPAEHGIGKWVPNVDFETIQGKKGKLSDFGRKKALVIAFTGASCPLSKRFAPDLATIEKEYVKKGVGFLFVDPIALDGAEDDLRELANLHGFKGPVVLDKDESLSRHFGAITTTEVFLLDAARTLVYRGPVSDRYGIGYQLDDARHNYLREALDAHLSGKLVPTPALWAPGCELDLGDKPATTLAVTYHNHVSRILQTHCVECHRKGGVGPFSLMSYADAKANAGMIRKVVSEGIMPPWFAAPTPKGHPSPWANERSLPESDKANLLSWIKAGKPEGDPTHAPLPRTFSSEWSIGKPDAIFELPREVPVKATGQMPYVNLKLKTNFAEDRWVEAAEVRPTAPEVVHHVLVFAVPGKGLRREQVGSLAAYVPGNSFFKYPEGTAKKLPAGAILHFQLHYTPNGKATKDRTRIGLRFAKKPPKETIRVIPVANKRISIPSGAPNHIETASRSIPRNLTVRAFMPHMHLRGKAFKYELVGTDGSRETLLDVPRYDFNWQLRYVLKEPRTIPAGSRIEVTGTFDNSEKNPANPNPETAVRWGDQSDDEMLIGYVECAIDTSTVGNESSAVDRFVQLDRNKDGVLTKDEFTHPALFPLFDEDKDGRVTRSEGGKGLLKLRKKAEELRKGQDAVRGLLNLFR